VTGLDDMASALRGTPVIVNAALEPGTVIAADIEGTGRTTIIVSQDVYDQLVHPTAPRSPLTMRRRFLKALPALILWAVNLALLGWILWQVFR
jgi:hypothetical protein